MLILDAESICVGTTPLIRVMLGTTEVWPGGVVNSGVTTGATVGTAVKKVADIVPYGLYGLRWTDTGEWASLTLDGMDNVLFRSVDIESGYMDVQSARRIRIVQMVPRADIPELSDGNLYANQTVYEGGSFALYDIFRNEYLSYNVINTVEFGPADSGSTGLLFDCTSGETDGNLLGMKWINVVDDNAWQLCAAQVIYGNNHFALFGTPKIYDAYPYNYSSEAEWLSYRVELVPLTFNT